MTLNVYINLTGGLAYKNRILGLDLHVNGKQHAELELPLGDEAFRTLKNALRAKRLVCHADVDALQKEAILAAGGEVPAALQAPIKDKRAEAVEALNALLEADAAEQVEVEQVEAAPEEAPVEETPAVTEEVPVEEAPAEDAEAKKSSKKRK